MEIRGWVYIIKNKSLSGLIKIGYSTKDPILRAIELGNTGVPHKYDLVYDALVINPHKIEKLVHESLKMHKEGKEWFRCSPYNAIECIKRVSGKNFLLESSNLNEINNSLYGSSPPKKNAPKTREELFNEARDALRVEVLLRNSKNK